MAEASLPDGTGAMGRNRKAYFSVVFQRGVTPTLIQGVLDRDSSLAGRGIRALEYAFGHQNPDGSFPFEPPAEYTGKQPGPGDLASAAAFFFSELGRSLCLLESSDWFQTNPDAANLRVRLQAVRGKADLSLTWLMSQQEELEAFDGQTANRLFFDALAFYLTGRALGRTDAMDAGESFALSAMRLRTSDGILLEKGGFDSSYQGVSLFRALILYVHADSGRIEFRRQLWKTIAQGVQWELSRVLPTGEISTEGNARVYPGGEDFLGNEKAVAYADVALAFYYYAVLAGDPGVKQAADNVIGYYANR
ncbi:MAG: hypothetical protein WBM17_03455 [Anaerolineales bacterium]